MASVSDHDQFTTWPCRVQLRRDIDRRAQIQPPVNEHAWDPGQPAGITKQRAIFEESGVVPVVRDESRKRHPETGVFVAWVG